MIFVDTNVIMYAVGRQHPLREQARVFFEKCLRESRPLVTSAEVLQELLHAYLPVGRVDTLEAALDLVTAMVPTVWSLEPEDVRHAHALMSTHPELGARDLIHLSCCQRRKVGSIKTFDRALAAAMGAQESI